MAPEPIICPKLPSPFFRTPPSIPPSWTALRPAVILHACSPGNGSPFRPVHIHTAWDDEQLHIFAHLEDDDIFNTSSSEPALPWTTGDTFEIFLLPPPGRNYHEIHTTPGNVQMRLFINAHAREKRMASQAPDSREWIFNAQLPRGSVISHTHVDHAQKFWNTLLHIPFRSLGLLPPQSGQQWKVLFSRYDYTQGIDAPSLSASSPQSEIKPNFHDQSRWHSFIFE